MDSGMLLQGVEEIKAGNVTLPMLLKIAMDLEKQLARFGALAQCVVDGTVYSGEKPVVKGVDQNAELYFILKTVKDAGKELEAVAKRGLEGTDEKKGNDGHMQRFAELLRAFGVTSVKVEGIGTCYIKTKSISYPPSKKEAEREIAFFTNLCQSIHLDLETATLEQVRQVADENKMKMPAYIEFQIYMREQGLTNVSWNWQALQKHVEGLVETGKEPPSFITVLKREEVVLRQS